MDLSFGEMLGRLAEGEALEIRREGGRLVLFESRSAKKIDVAVIDGALVVGADTYLRSETPPDGLLEAALREGRAALAARLAARGARVRADAIALGDGAALIERLLAHGAGPSAAAAEAAIRAGLPDLGAELAAALPAETHARLVYAAIEAGGRAALDALVARGVAPFAREGEAETQRRAAALIHGLMSQTARENTRYIDIMINNFSVSMCGSSLALPLAIVKHGAADADGVVGALLAHGAEPKDLTAGLFFATLVEARDIAQRLITLGARAAIAGAAGMIRAIFGMGPWADAPAEVAEILNIYSRIPIFSDLSPPAAALERRRALTREPCCVTHEPIAPGAAYRACTSAGRHVINAEHAVGRFANRCPYCTRPLEPVLYENTDGEELERRRALTREPCCVTRAPPPPGAAYRACTSSVRHVVVAEHAVGLFARQCPYCTLPLEPILYENSE